MDWGSACFFLFCAAAVLGGAAFDYRKRKLLYLERLSAIEKGISLESLSERPLQVYFRRGLLWLIPGLGLAALLALVPGYFSMAWGGAAVLMSCLGVAYLLYYFLKTRGSK